MIIINMPNLEKTVDKITELDRINKLPKGTVVIVIYYTVSRLSSITNYVCFDDFDEAANWHQIKWETAGVEAILTVTTDFTPILFHSNY